VSGQQSLVKGMKKRPKSRKAPSAERIARLAETGINISRFFTNKGQMMQPVRPAGK
jgi:hypothetical protein